MAAKLLDLIRLATHCLSLTTHPSSPPTQALVVDDEGAERGKQSSYELMLIRLAPGQNGLELVAQLRQRWPASPPVLLRSHLDPDEVRAVLAECAVGRASPGEMTPGDLDQAICAVLGLRRETQPAPSREALARQVGLLNSVVRIVAQVHRTTTAEDAVSTTVRAAGALFGARVSLEVELAGARFEGHHDPFAEEPAALDAAMVVPLEALHGGAAGELRCERAAPPFDHAEETAAIQIAHASAEAIEKHALLAAAQDRTRESEAIVAMVSHDLLAPVQTFLFGLDALRAGPSHAATASILASLGRTTDHMRLLLEDLLDVGRIHHGRLAIRPAAVRPSDVFSAVVDPLRAQAAAKSLALTWKPFEEPTEVVVDEGRLRQALDNLVSNAIRHARAAVSLHLTRSEGAVRFHVVDDGPGVRGEERAHIFERLRQGPEASAGTLGLGLYIVDGIARAHGGRAGVDDAPGGGSDFWLEVPQSVDAGP